MSNDPVAPEPTTEVIRNEDASRYELVVDGERAGLADYVELVGDVVEVPHTEVDPAHGGKGYGGVLVRGVLDDLAARSAKVKPTCPFVESWITKHPDYEALRA